MPWVDGTSCAPSSSRCSTMRVDPAGVMSRVLVCDLRWKKKQIQSGVQSGRSRTHQLYKYLAAGRIVPPHCYRKRKDGHSALAQERSSRHYTLTRCRRHLPPTAHTRRERRQTREWRDAHAVRYTAGDIPQGSARSAQRAGCGPPGRIYDLRVQGRACMEYAREPQPAHTTHLSVIGTSDPTHIYACMEPLK